MNAEELKIIHAEELKAIRDLKTTAGKLNQASDSLAEAINHLNKALGDLNLGVEAWVELPNRKGTRFGYARITNSNWQLAFSIDGCNALGLSQASRELRIECMSATLPLLKKLKVRAEELTQSILDEIPAEVA
jgi:hypothetical protein